MTRFEMAAAYHAGATTPGEERMTYLGQRSDVTRIRVRRFGRIWRGAEDLDDCVLFEEELPWWRRLLRHRPERIAVPEDDDMWDWLFEQWCRAGWFPYRREVQR